MDRGLGGGAGCASGSATGKVGGVSPRKSEIATTAGALRHPPKQRRAALTLARIEKAAIAMIAKHGRDGFTTNHIAAEAGMSIGLIYRYFDDRKAILSWLYPEHIEGLGPLREGAGNPPPES